MRVVECNVCGEPLSAATDDELERRVRSHMEAEHSAEAFSEDSAHELVANEAYEASDS